MIRGSGILLHITSLPSRCGIGDLGPAAYSFAERLSAAGQRYWQILPLNPTNQGAGNSPYFSMSAFPGNPMLVSPEMLVESGRLSEDALEGMPEWPADEVDFAVVNHWKGNLLKRSYSDLQDRPSDRQRFEAFCRDNAEWLDDFALFMVIKDRQDGRPWTEWPVALRNRDREELERVRRENRRALEEIRFQQFLFHIQWDRLRARCRELDILLVGDVPIYVALDSADIWAHPHLFKLDGNLQPTAVSGVPPDYFSDTGQLWNTPVYNWQQLEKTGFAWWTSRMERMFALYDIVRIDHFRGLIQYWEVPANEETAIGGSWKDVPSIAFFDALKAALPDFGIIAEDLGVITDDVIEVMERYRFPGMKVLVFAFGTDDPEHVYLPHNYTHNSVVYTGTHDTNTLIGWWEEEASQEERDRLFRYLGRSVDQPQLHWEALRLALASVADMAILPLQDLLGLPASARMNDPSTGDGNWGWRCSREQMEAVDWDRLAGMTWVYGRNP